MEGPTTFCFVENVRKGTLRTATYGGGTVFGPSPTRDGPGPTPIPYSLSFRVIYHKNPDTDSARIVGFEVTPHRFIFSSLLFMEENRKPRYSDPFTYKRVDLGRGVQKTRGSQLARNSLETRSKKV
ncbi:hypothetical protein HanRHA438_Chr04g0151601 [Helianthus annuus]|uniref:Uncharacterized protein n=1 Tax=Helianthus annuus TaxID=4232 RepID=A0A9K3J3Z5_HELAN|nr:hypothetical protein HanXRQr2_Chr04g0140131 [Helianthus annuus]KAJ0586414.1 hypothetical protein HanIR_Chr04g0151651 [Helianthus annuus]KAJ0595163.1 hypothetical protein HanHA89_Chr04g0128351 [Helianthus annuus]KAJ0924716.1 hypothetical protein HanRHA438_Chr04g0151601 [Helianthus annuus]